MKPVGLPLNHSTPIRGRTLVHDINLIDQQALCRSSRRLTRDSCMASTLPIGMLRANRLRE
ncbi:hypothetical protein GBA52_024779 [Prunus armeniaca]|nr:hypothetical protein GBA52_024779 [Prunus armeniaca]